MRAERVLPAGAWDAAHEVDQVLADYDHRHRRRLVLMTQSGRSLLLDLPHAVRLRNGDGLETEAGIVRVCARPEALLEIAAPDPRGLARLAWHLGNRHLPVQFAGAHIRILADHVIEDMLRGLGASIERIEAPFDPEAGAYSGLHHHQHDRRDDD